MVKRFLCLFTLAAVVISASSDTAEAGSKKRRFWQPKCVPQISCQPVCCYPTASPQLAEGTTGAAAKPIDPDEESLPTPKAVDPDLGIPVMQP